MTPPDRLIAATSAIGLIAMLAGCFNRSEPEPVVQPVPFATAFHCPPHGPGLSRTLVVFADENEAGEITGMSCVRMRERGKGRIAL